MVIAQQHTPEYGETFPNRKLVRSKWINERISEWKRGNKFCDTKLLHFLYLALGSFASVACEYEHKHILSKCKSYESS